MLQYLTILFTLLLLAFLGIRHLMVTEEKNNKKSEAEHKRRTILAKVKPFLAPYYDIWRNIKIHNDNCSIKLLEDGITIVITEKNKEFPRTFTVLSSPIPNLWKKLCTEFNEVKTYDILLEECKKNNVQIEESIIGKTPPKQEEVSIRNEYKKERDIDI